MHALVVGGTGMLVGVTLELARRGHAVTVISRRAEQFAPDVANLHRVSLDYRDTDKLENTVLDAQDRLGSFGLIVAWIHSLAPEAPMAVARVARGNPCRFVHVLGSAAADPARPDPGRRAAFALLEQIIYNEVILGFRLEHGRSRWLTDAEISAGVLHALDHNLEASIVGTVEPWSARPGF